MKSSNRQQKQATVAGVLLLVGAVFFSCKSAPEEVKKIKVNAFDTLEQDSNVYVRIPVKQHSELTNNLLKAVVGNDVQDKYLKNIIDNIDTVYIGSGSASNKNRIQIACDGTIPSAAKLALSSMENWSKSTKTVNTAGVYQVFTEERTKMQFCLPGSDLICISRDLTPQLTLYDKEAKLQGIEAVLSDETLNNSKWKESEIYKYVGSTKTNNVRLYMNSPLAFVTSLLGVSLSTSIFQLNFLEGDVRLLPSGKYAIDLDMEFSRTNLVARASSFLKVALLLTDSKVEVLDDTHLRVTDIQVSMAQLQRILGLNKI